MKLLFQFLAISGLILFSLLTVKAQQSQNVTFVHDGKTVYATFTTPAGNGPFATIIINPGSGANDRDGTLPMTGANVACLYPALLNDTLRPYKELAEALTDSGFAVLRYDKLEYTYPSTLGTITFHKLWLPVESAIEYVKTRNDVDTSQIILLGHSEGSALIPFIANNRADIKALISVAGARTPFDSLLAYQLVNIAQSCGGNVAQAQAQAGQILAYYNIVRTHSWNTGTPLLFGVPASVWYDYVQATDPVATYYNSDHLPTLFLGMGLDINVPPAELIRFQNDITIPADFWSIPGLIHYMTSNQNPAFSRSVSDTIVYWLRQHNITTGISSFHPANEEVQVFPNPFHTQFSVRIKTQNSIPADINIRNILGQTIRHYQTTSQDMEVNIGLGDQPDGIYLLEVSLNGRFQERKLIKY